MEQNAKTLFIAICHTIVMFIYIRFLVIDEVKVLYLGKSQQKLRKRSQSVLEWLLCLRYKDTIPNLLLYVYYIVLAIHPLWILLSIFGFFYKSILPYAILCKHIVAWFDGAVIIVIALLSITKNPRGFATKPFGFDYKQWAKKPKKPKK